MLADHSYKTVNLQLQITLKNGQGLRYVFSE
jgi:hypothetical protein